MGETLRARVTTSAQEALAWLPLLAETERLSGMTQDVHDL